MGIFFRSLISRHHHHHHRCRRRRPMMTTMMLQVPSSQWSTTTFSWEETNSNNNNNQTSTSGGGGGGNKPTSPLSSLLPTITTATTTTTRRCVLLRTARNHSHSTLVHLPSLLSSSSQPQYSHNTNIKSYYYHTTSRKEILPFLFLGGLFVGIQYTYRALQQMDYDWEMYYRQVEEYKARTGIDLLNLEGVDENSRSIEKEVDGNTTKNTKQRMKNNNFSTLFSGGTLAMDIGTRRWKVSYHQPLPPPPTTTTTTTSTSKALPSVMVDKEGYRYTPSLVWIPMIVPPISSSSSSLDDTTTDHSQRETIIDETIVLSGRLAESRLYDGKGGYTIPLQDILLSKKDGTNDKNNHNNHHPMDSIHEKQPWQAMMKEGKGSTILSHILRNVADNALEQVLGGSSSSRGNSKNNSRPTTSKPLFVMDESILPIAPPSGSHYYNVRPIFTFPPPPSTMTKNNNTIKTDTTVEGGMKWKDEEEKESNGYPKIGNYLEQYQRAIDNLTSPVGIALYVPEPIAIVTGAEYFHLLPPRSHEGTTTTTTTANTTIHSSSSVLVVDIGGTTTCISLVGTISGNDEDPNGKDLSVLYSTYLPFGGDTFVDLLVSYLIHDFQGRDPPDSYNHVKSSSSSSSSSSSADDVVVSGTTNEDDWSTRPKLNDPMALQRLHEASTTAIHELSSKIRSEINIPYLSIDMLTRQPKHLKMGVSRNIVNAEVETWIRNKLVPYYLSFMAEQSSTANSATTTKQRPPSSMMFSTSPLSQSIPPPTNLATLFSSTLLCALERTSHTPDMLRAILVVGGGARIPLIRDAMRESVISLAGEVYALGGDSSGRGKRLIIPENGEFCDELGVLGAVVWGSNS